MAHSNKKIFFLAGENSGDQRVARVVEHIRRERPDWDLSGFGGPLMERAGMRLERDMVHDMAIVGLVEVLTKAHKVYSVYRMVRDYLARNRPDAVVLVDYPGFNLGLVAPLAKKLGIPVIYYIAPQFWAWHRSRVAKFKKYCDKIIPILPFEETLLREEGINAEYLGHSLLDSIEVTQSRTDVCRGLGIDPGRKLIGLLPGSRKREVRAILPVMLDAAQRLRAERDDLEFVLSRAATTPRSLLESLLEGWDVPVTVVNQNDPNHNNIRAALDFSWVKSGTSTLEAALLGVPFVIIYKVNYITAWIGRRLVTTAFFGLPNIIAGEMVVPELLQEKATGLNLADQTSHFLSNARAYGNMQYQLRKIRETLGSPGSSERTGRAIIDFLEQPRA